MVRDVCVMRSLVGKSLASRGGAVRRRSTNAEKAKQPPNNLRREFIPGAWATPVSYTHLTLPTNREV